MVRDDELSLDIRGTQVLRVVPEFPRLGGFTGLQAYEALQMAVVGVEGLLGERARR
jgi:hypothetical protein